MSSKLSNQRICTHESQCPAPSHFGDCKSMESLWPEFVLIETSKGWEVWPNERRSKLVANFREEADARLFIKAKPGRLVESKKPRRE